MKHIKKFNEHNFCSEFEDESEDFMEMYGYKLGKTFLFAPYQSDDIFGIVICPKSYWDNERHCYDGSTDGVLLDMPSGFGEASESDFEYDGPLEEAIEKLVLDGFKYSRELQAFIDERTESCDQLRIDGENVSVEEYITKKYPEVLV